MLNAIGESGLGRKIDQFARLFQRNRERLLAQNVFARFESRAADGIMQRVGRQNMDSVDGGIFEQLLDNLPWCG